MFGQVQEGGQFDRDYRWSKGLVLFRVISFFDKRDEKWIKKTGAFIYILDSYKKRSIEQICNKFKRD